MAEQSRSAIEAKAQEVLRQSTTDILMNSLAELLFKTIAAAMSPEQRMTHFWIVNELERRYPAAEQLMSLWANDETLRHSQRYGHALICAVEVVRHD